MRENLQRAEEEIKEETIKTEIKQFSEIHGLSRLKMCFFFRGTATGQERLESGLQRWHRRCGSPRKIGRLQHDAPTISERPQPEMR
jgi:hypothetical protein